MDSLSFGSWLGSLRDAAPANTGYFKNTPNITPNRVPALWTAFAKQGEGIINQGFAARKRSLASGRRDFERELLNVYQSSGLDQLFARRQLAESAPQFQQRFGELEAGRLDEILGFRSGIANALAESNSSERQLDIQGHLAAKARQAARKGAKSAGHLGLLGAAIGAGGAALGGFLGRPAGGASPAYGGSLPGAY